jgi:flagellar basal-body rod modification protein FlgD
MTSINTNSSLGVSTSAATSNSTSSTTTNTKNLGQADFLKLMTAQMTHQDPTQPMTNGDFLSQMAQFGTVNGIQGLQTSFDNFASSMTSNQTLQASNLVGHSVLAPSNQGLLTAGGTIKGSIDLSGSSPDVTVKIIDPSTGSVIRNIDLGSQSAGSVPFVWDGNTNAGTAASPGVYQIQTESMLNGYNTTLTPNIESQVESVSVSSGTQGMQVNLTGLGSINFSQVKQIL